MKQIETSFTSKNYVIERCYYADILRIISTFAVIILHVSATYWSNYAIGSKRWYVCNIYNSLVRWCVPVFFMISGMFFLDPQKEITIKKIFSKYILRILMTLVFWSAFYRFWNMFVQHEIFSIHNVLKAIATIPFGPAWYHLWFLYTIIAVYILCPLYRLITKYANQNDGLYFIIIFLVFGLFLPIIKCFLVNINGSYNVNFEIKELTTYSGYFIAGYFLKKYNVKNNIRYICYLLGIISILFTIIAVSYNSIKANQLTFYFHGIYLHENLSPTIMFEAFSVFLFFKYMKIKLPQKMEKIIFEISNCTYGIYLIHVFIMAYVFNLRFLSLINPIFAIPLTSFIIFFVSYIYIYRKKNSNN